MIVTYLLDIRTLPDPVEDEQILEGLPEERIEKIRRLRHPASRKQSLGAGLLLEHGLHQAAAYSKGRKHGYYETAFHEKLYRHNSKKENRDTAPVIRCGAFGKPYLADCGCGAYGRPYETGAECGVYNGPYMAGAGCGGYSRPGETGAECSSYSRPGETGAGCDGYSRPGVTEAECGVYSGPCPSSCRRSGIMQETSAVPFNLSHTGSYVIASVMFYEKDCAAVDQASCSSTSIEHAAGNSIDLGHAAGNSIGLGHAAGNSTAVEHHAIGCDIEQVKSYNPRIARRFFTKAEYQMLEETDGRLQAEMFCRYWTRKESVIKMTGLGMSLPLDLFEISSGAVRVPDRDKMRAWQASAEGQKQAEAYSMAGRLLLDGTVYLKEYQQDDCCITVCSTHDQFASELVAVSQI